jgi:hypothetical protein
MVCSAPSAPPAVRAHSVCAQASHAGVQRASVHSASDKTAVQTIVLAQLAARRGPASRRPELEPPAERPSAVARVSSPASRAGRVKAAEGARAAGRSAWTRASTTPSWASDGGDTAALPVGASQAPSAGAGNFDVADDTFPRCLDPTKASSLRALAFHLHVGLSPCGAAVVAT